MRLCVSLLALTSALSSPVAAKPRQTPAQGMCDTYAGKIVLPISFDEAIKAYGKVRPKSEFETTAAYIAKLSMQPGLESKPMIVLRAPLAPNALPYDADKQKLLVGDLAFPGTSLRLGPSLEVERPDVDWGNLLGHEAEVSNVQTEGSPYQAENSFGVKFMVERRRWTVQAIYEPTKNFPSHGLFRSMPGQIDPSIVDIIRLPPKDAEVLKPQLRAAFLVIPGPPYLVKFEHIIHSASPDNPLNIVADVTVLIAKFQCGFLLDGENRVFRVYPAQ